MIRSLLVQSDARHMGLDPERWEHALDFVRQACERDELPAASLCVGRHGKTTGVHQFGRQRLDGAAPLRDDAVFLVASITKPIVALGVLLLVEEGRLALEDRAEDYVRPFGREGKHAVTIRHLLTHTSGLPDMLPNNRELRREHARLEDFVEETCRSPLLFPPGRGVQYQSMGYAVLGAIIEHVSGATCAEFLRQRILDPLGMRDSRLGAPDDWFEGPQRQAERIAEIRVPPDQIDEASWNWNSTYWRKLGAPWGGLLSTARDLAELAQLHLNQGQAGGRSVVSPAVIRESTRNQLTCFRELPEADVRCRPWGFGWRMNWPGHRHVFGDLLGQRAFGHWGATGTLLWIDPDLDGFLVLLTSQTHDPGGQILVRISNVITAAFAFPGERGA